MPKFLKLLLKWVFALIFIGGGINHFRDPGFYLRMMPDYLPFHAELVMISGVMECLLGVLFLIPQTTKLAAVGIILLLLAVFPANIHMAMHPQDFSEIPPLGLWLRLPFQGVLIWWAYSYLKNSKRKRSRSIYLYG